MLQHGVISTAEDRLFIQPSSHLDSNDDTPHSRHTHTITKSASAPPPPPHSPTECTAKETRGEESHTPASTSVGEARRRRLAAAATATADTETYVETVVVADQSMLEHHQLLDGLEAYVFTLMNIVRIMLRWLKSMSVLAQTNIINRALN